MWYTTIRSLRLLFNNVTKTALCVSIEIFRTCCWYQYIMLCCAWYWCPPFFPPTAVGGRGCKLSQDSEIWKHTTCSLLTFYIIAPHLRPSLIQYTRHLLSHQNTKHSSCFFLHSTLQLSELSIILTSMFCYFRSILWKQITTLHR